MGLASSFRSLFGLQQRTQAPAAAPPSTRTSLGRPVPGPSNGLLGWLRMIAGGWPGPSHADGLSVADRLLAERIATGPRNIVLPNFLPYFDDKTGETAEMRIWYRRMLACPEVRTACVGKLLGVASLQLQIHPAEKKDPKHKAVAEFVRWNLTRRLTGGIPGLIWDVLIHALVDGYSVNEKVWGHQEQGKHRGKWPLRQLKPKVTGDDVVLQTDEYGNTVGLYGLRYNAGLEFEPAKFLIYTHQPLFGRPTGQSDFRAAYGSYWILDTAWKLRAIGLEKRAYPVVWGSYPAGGETTVRPTLEEGLARLKSSNWISVPESVKLQVLDIAASGDAVFHQTIQDLVHRVFLCIQGAILQSLEGTTADGRGDTKEHRATADLFVWHLAESVVALLNDEERGLIRDMVDLNYVVDEYPYATLSAVDVDELTKELQVDTGLQALGLDLSKEETYERYGRTPPEEKDDTLPGAQAQPPGGGLGDMLGGGGGDGQPPDDGSQEVGFAEFAEDPFDSYAAETGFTGEKKDKAGRRMCYQKGKRVPCAQPQKPAKEAKPTAEAVKGRIQALLSGKEPITPAHIKGMAETLAKMTVAEMTAVKKQLGVRASGAKLELARKIAEKALAKKPEPKPPAAKKAPAKAPERPAKPAAPVFEPAEHVGKLVDAVRAHGAAAHGLADLADVRDALKGLSRPQQDAVIQQARKQGLVTGSAAEGRHGLTPRQKAALLPDEGGNDIGFLSVKDQPEKPKPSTSNASPAKLKALAGKVEEALGKDKYGGVQSAEHAVRVGKLVVDHLDEQVKPLAEAWRKVKTELEAAQKAGRIDPAKVKAEDEAGKKLIEARRTAYREALQAIRPMGLGGQQALAEGSDPAAKALYEKAANYYPAQWHLRSRSQPLKLTADPSQPNQYDERPDPLDDEAPPALNLQPGAGIDSAVHEMAHRMEHIHPWLGRLQGEYLQSRSKGVKEGPGGRDLHDAGFESAYMGSTSNSGRHFEILSRGLEMMLGSRQGMEGDPQTRHFLMGLMAGAGPR